MPAIAAVVATPLAAASVGDATFSISATSTVWQQPYQNGRFFLAQYTLVNDGTAPGKPTFVIYAATERISLALTNVDPLWTVTAGPTAYSKTLTYTGPDIAVNGVVIVGGTEGGYFRGTVANTPPNWAGNAAQRQSNFNIAAAVSPAGATPSSLDDGNYPN